jgi:8-oxo-dGTP pyrophosphatase MutT (NUDIX family)
MKIQDVYDLILEKRVGTFSGAGVIFFDGEKVLLLKKHNGAWVFPGGKPVQGESPIQTAKRETREEVGSCPGEKINELVFEYDDRTFHSFIFKINTIFDVKISDEHKDYTWINYKKILELKLHKNVFRNIKKVIKELKKIS